MPAGDWVDDIAVQTTKELTTTGGTVWNAARRCAAFLESEATSIGLDRPAVRVLELGAGCGLLGLLVARNTPAAAEVCLTEQAHGGALEHLRLNAQANRHLPHMNSVSTCACDWTHFLDAQLVQAVRSGAAVGSGGPSSLEGAAAAPAAGSCCSGLELQQQQQQQQQEHPDTLVQQQQSTEPVQPADPAGQGSSSSSSAPPSAAELADMAHLLCSRWDIIIGSDLVYNSAGVVGFPRVLAALMQPHTRSTNSATASAADHPDHNQQQPQQQETVMYYAHTKHRFDAMDVDLFDQLQGLGLCVQEVVEEGQELPPPSPPPFSSLYPELRCAVFKISRPAAAEEAC